MENDTRILSELSKRVTFHELTELDFPTTIGQGTFNRRTPFGFGALFPVLRTFSLAPLSFGFHTLVIQGMLARLTWVMALVLASNTVTLSALNRTC